MNSFDINFGKKFFANKQKLTEENVREIKQLLRQKSTAKDLAAKYNVTASYIRRINRGEVWGWVE